MKFNEMPYTHLEYEEIKKEYDLLNNELEAAKTSKEFMETFNKINEFRNHISTMAGLAQVRHTINTADEFYNKENDYWDNTYPLLAALENRFESIVLNYPKREELDIPEVFFIQKEMSQKVFSEEIVEDLQTENKLVSEYGKLKSSAKIEFDGEVYNLASIGPLMESDDRATRKRAALAVSGFYKEHEEEFDNIYDKLVKVRAGIAKKLGFDNFVEVGYLRMKRIGYKPEDVKVLRDQIINEIVPLTCVLRDRQAERLGLDKLYIYDKNYFYKSGNAKPCGNKDELVEAALKMYTEMSPETAEFFKFMYDNEMFDLESKPNKELGGYCTTFDEFKAPFIFSNFNGTSGDVDVLTHEAGHAFQAYSSMKNISISDLLWPSNEAAEIHSMSMEFFAYPWMENFFKEETAKYKHSHTIGTLNFVPYGCLVDHFQHEVYEKPEMSKEERKATWRRLEKIYMPYVDYEDDSFMDKGTWWYRQGHIFQAPFYYIDYVLAQVCALQFRCRMLKNDPQTWNDYVNLCKLGGTKPFLGLVESAGLKNPFVEGTIKETVDYIKEDLEKIDDLQF